MPVKSNRAVGVDIMKTLVRVLVSLVCAVFGSLTVSVATCAAQNPPVWLERVCGSDVESIWLLSGSLFFVLTYGAVGRHGRPFRHFIAAVMLGAYGIYAVVYATREHVWWAWIVGICGLTAAVGVAARRGWARGVVWILALLYLGQWSYHMYLATAGGYFWQIPLGEGIVSLLPWAVYLLMAGYCCYVVSAKEFRGISTNE
jgi:hypothetical protein